MRGALSILITVLICMVVLALYFFLGRSQLNKQMQAVEASQQSARERLAKINKMREELPSLMQQLPHWRDRLALYKQAIPEPISDEGFLALLARQLEAQDVQLLAVDVTPQGQWLGKLGEEQQKELASKGIDPEQAAKVMSALYSINLLGKFENVLAAFENMKRYRRLYTIDEVSSPSGGGPGSITQVVDPDVMGIQVTGRIYYGIPDDYLKDADLIKVFEGAVIKPLAKRMQSQIAAEGLQLLDAAHSSGMRDAGTENSDGDSAMNTTGDGPIVAGRPAERSAAIKEG